MCLSRTRYQLGFTTRDSDYSSRLKSINLIACTHDFKFFRYLLEARKANNSATKTMTMMSTLMTMMRTGRDRKLLMLTFGEGEAGRSPCPNTSPKHHHHYRRQEESQQIIWRAGKNLIFCLCKPSFTGIFCWVTSCFWGHYKVTDDKSKSGPQFWVCVFCTRPVLGYHVVVSGCF